MLMIYWRRQVEEIAHDPALRWCGSALALVNCLSAFNWLSVQPLSDILDPAQTPICWPFLDNCYSLRLLSPDAVQAVVFLFGALSLFNAALFSQIRLTGIATKLLLALNLVKLLIIVQDYRLILSQHHMALWAAVTFLFLPSKRRTLPYLLILFYSWAGSLKLNHDWLSGLDLYGVRPLGLPQSLVPFACAYVVLLELFLVLGLLSRRLVVFWSVLLQVILFHIASFWSVGAFYPCLMFLLLSFFLAVRFRPLGSQAPPSVRSLILGLEHPSTYALLAAFCAMQLVPRVMSSSPSVTGEGRMFALHMFDAPVECLAFLRPDTSPNGDIRLDAPYLHARVACDPVVYRSLALDYCRRIGRGNDFDLRLLSKKRGQVGYQTVVSIDSFCARPPPYRIWMHNWWIHDS